MAFSIINRPAGDSPIPAGAPIWRTCLREVQFADEVDERPASDSGAPPTLEGDAYRLMLEILCGLQSPMLGETQVMGQFKSFLSSLGQEQGWLTRLGQRLLADAGEVRTQHLQGLGSRSYGSAVRRHLSDVSHAAVIGTGKLAREILPFLADEGRSVDQWGRTAADLPSVTFLRLEDPDEGTLSALPTAVLVAAPVCSDVVARVAVRYGALRCVVDLRGELGHAPLQVPAPVITLQDLFAQMTAASGAASHRIQAARADIASRSRRYELRDELRPFGWDDLCA
jgi:glutamyl-tRNA reductase